MATFPAALVAVAGDSDVLFYLVLVSCGDQIVSMRIEQKLSPSKLSQ